MYTTQSRRRQCLVRSTNYPEGSEQRQLVPGWETDEVLTKTVVFYLRSRVQIKVHQEHSEGNILFFFPLPRIYSPF